MEDGSALTRVRLVYNPGICQSAVKGGNEERNEIARGRKRRLVTERRLS